MPGRLDDLKRAYAAIIENARADVAAGRVPNAPALEARIRAAGQQRSIEGIDAAERAALRQLERVVAVQRARARVARAPATRPAAPPRSATLRTRPSISGNMEVRRERDGEAFVLGWDAAAAVTEWEVRFAERVDPRADYEPRGALTLPGAAAVVELPLGRHPLRVHLLGRGRGGRLVRRAVISALTRENWNDRWQRRASAS